MIFGDRVREAREIIGVTQGELAERVGIDRTAITHIEAGRQQPRPGVLSALVFHLGFPRSFFEEEATVEFPEGSLLFRARASMTSRERAQAHRYGQLLYRQTRPLLERVRVPTVTLPRLSEATPEVAAAHARAALGLSPDTPIRHLLNAVERSGVLVLAIPIQLEKRDAYCAWVGDEALKPVIVIMGAASGDRLRFSVAHELGHLVMTHRQSAHAKEIEDAANAFAGFLLFPRSTAMLEIQLPVTLGSLARLKPKWGMSIQALVSHARRLGLVTPRQERYLYQQVGQRGWRKKEPENLDVAAEKPRAIRKVLEGFYGVPLDYRRAAADLRMEPHFLRNLIEAYATRSDVPARPSIDPATVAPLHLLHPSGGDS